MKTTETTSALKYSRTKFYANGARRITVKVRLNDECRNGHEDFSITADIDAKTANDRWRDESGGCLHDEIAKHFPEFRPFIALHLSDWEGSPMYAVANGFYWLTGCTPEAFPGATKPSETPAECREILASHLRATDKEIDALLVAGIRDQDHFSYYLEENGFRARWQTEAHAATKQLEELTGQTFESKATRRQWEPLTAEKASQIRERLASGYYLPEQVAARDAIKRQDAKAERLATIRAEHAHKLAKLNAQLAVDLLLAEQFDGNPNVIYYDHTNTLAANWQGAGMRSYCKTWTRDEWDKFVATVDLSRLPAGIRFEFKE